MKKIALIFTACAGLLFFTSATTNYFEIAKYLDIFVGVYKSLNTYYVDDVNPEEIVTKGIDAILEDLDPYSDYIPSEEIERFELQSTGEYGGIGATIQKVNEYITVVAPHEGSPADQAGLQSGDKFLEVDGVSGKDKSTEEIIRLLKGKPGTDVKVLIGRGDDSFERVITRDLIKIKNVTYADLQDNGIGYIKLSSFTNGAGDEVAAALQEFKKHGQLKGIVLDLKGNGGGLLAEAIDVSNVFLPRGETIVTIKTRDGAGDKSYKSTEDPVDLTTPLVVLIDGGTASASEIVSGSIQDLDRGVIVGRNSFGKGLVQSTRDLSYDTKLKLTTAKYLIPSGRCVQRLNYSEKDENGEPLEVPDSLRTAFKTKNGRTVYDGSGVSPDITVKAEPFPQVAFTLFAKNYIYDYSIKYKTEHPSIPEPENFQLSETDYDNFKLFLSDKDYSYQTDSEVELEELKKAAEEEKHDEEFDRALITLEENLQKSKADDLDKYEEEIKFLLEREIASRYYYTAGKVANGLDEDDELRAATQILVSPTRYSEILSPK